MALIETDTWEARRFDGRVQGEIQAAEREPAQGRRV